MQIKTFTIPAISEDSYTEELNRFLRANKVLEIKKEFVNNEYGTYWAICVTYLPLTPGGTTPPSGHFPKSDKVDYREVLSATAFEQFAVLRKLRKQLADENAVPAFSVFTNSELADIARLDTIDPASIKKIPGIGSNRVEKYGEVICQMYQQAKSQSDEAHGQPDESDT